MSNKISEYWKTLRSATKSDFMIIAGITLLFVIMIVLNVRLVFNMISDQTEEIGQMELERIRSELQTTLTDAEKTIMRIALDSEQIMKSNASNAPYDSNELLNNYFIKQTKVQSEIFNEACFQVYIAGRNWAIIPGFDIPSDYHPPERIWYKGAVENPNKIYITEPYIDANTGVMCFTISTMLSDNETVVALDFNLNNTQKSIDEMSKDGDRIALITNKSGKIISYTDMSLVGENIAKSLPEYEGVLNKIIHQSNHDSFSAQINDTNHTIFSSATNNGWYLILGVDDSALYKDSYKQTFINVILNLLMVVVIIVLYIIGVKNRINAEQALHVKEEFLSGLSHELHEPLKKILTLSNIGKLGDDFNPKENAALIRESATQLSAMLDNLFTFSNIVSNEKNNDVDIMEQNIAMSKTGRKMRIGIVTALIVAMISSIGVYINTIMTLGNSRMLHEVDVYNYQLTNWIERERSILSMFASAISGQPELMDNYDAAVKWLDIVARNYPEISVCYMANPYKEHQVIMNNGWEGPPGWRVEQRPWYIGAEKSDDGFSISAPYYDDQTGLYCVTLSQVVYGKNGEFLGIFGIDFFLDKLIDILGESYTKDSYAFLIDRNGIIINHPSEDYELSVDNTTPISITRYAKAYESKVITNFDDYNDAYSISLAKKNESSDFTVMVVNRWWSIYENIFILGALLLILFGLCILAVNTLVNRLIQWQETVNRQLKKSADTAVAAGQAKSQFLAQMSHEIRTPINAIIGMNEMILRECKDGGILKYSNNVAQASDNLLSLINDILDFSKIESGKMELFEETYQLDELIKNLINMVKSRAEKKNLDFKVKVNENIPNELFGDSVRIRQVVVNFLTNAVKYTQVGSVYFTVDMEDRSSEEIILIFSIKDTGIGIREEDKQKLFKDFERFDSKRNKNIEGTGLGLAITSKLVKMMNGRIEVESVYGEGSTFTVMIPQKIMSSEVVGRFEEKLKSMKTKQDTYQVSFIAPDAQILVVDDNEMNLLVATSLLKATQIQVDTAISGMIALKKMAEKKYDIVFLDQMMPSLDGIQTLKLAKEMKDNKSQDAPIIALTANVISGAREMFLREGFNDYLTKPIDAKAMEEMLMEYLPADKLKEPPNINEELGIRNEELNQEIQDEQRNESAQFDYKYLDPELGLQYSSGMEDMYKEILTMFCNLKDEKKLKIQEAFDKEDWRNYTTFVHALKSTSLSIGGTQLSEAAKQLEMSGKMCISENTSELEKYEGAEYIKEHHAEAMKLYDKLVEEGLQYLNSESIQNIQDEQNNKVAKVDYKYLDPELGLQYSSGIEDMYKEILTMFCNLKDEKKLKIQEAFDKEDWQNYTTFVHALKSTSLSIGGTQLSEATKQLEMSGKMCISENTSELEKYEGATYIKEHHAEAMKLYDKLVEEGLQYLNSELRIPNYALDLQEAFENEDWVMYSIMLQEIKSDSAVFKQLDMACKMINADFTTDQEKAEAIKYIKEHHADIIKTVAEE